MLSPLTLAKIAQAAYTGRSVYGRPCTLVEVKHSAVYTMRVGDETVAAFPGSNSPLDWLFNVMRFRKHGIHAGFLSTYEMLEPHIPKADHYVGHSQGGAIAQIAGALHHPQAIVTTFGSPRVFSPKRAREWPLKTARRYYLQNDPIARVPVYGYQHVGRGIALPCRGGPLAHDIRTYIHSLGEIYVC